MADNLQALIQAGVVPDRCRDDLTDEDIEAINSLTDDEVTYMISGAQKLGDDFFKRHCPHGFYF